MKQGDAKLLGFRAAQRGAGSSAGAEGVVPVTALDRWLGRRIVRATGRPPVRIALWDGGALHDPPGAVGGIVFRDRGALWATVLAPEIGFGDGYTAGRIEIEGDLVEVLFRAFRSIDAAGSHGFKRGLLGTLPHAASNTLAASRSHVHRHYDLGNDFYRQWLDERMVYTCAYYTHPGATLEEAQVAKMDHVCRKLRLEPGMEVIEAGCGWGALTLHMAGRFGARVRAYNISREQISFARARAREEGLDDRVEFIEDDYRNISGRCDAFVSVGMLEHVGIDRYRELGDVIARVLAVEGRGLLHSVARIRPEPPSAWLERRIFPGSHPPSLREMMGVFEPRRFSVLDVENLRLHYARTLMEWLRRFDAVADRVREDYDEQFVRAWRLYLGGCAASFLSSSTQLYQVVFAPAENNALPLTREHQYGGASAVWDRG